MYNYIQKTIYTNMYRICTCERAFAVQNMLCYKQKVLEGLIFISLEVGLIEEGLQDMQLDLFVCCVKLLCELIEEAWDDLIRGNGVLVSKSKSQKMSLFFFWKQDRLKRGFKICSYIDRQKNGCLKIFLSFNLFFHEKIMFFFF